MGAVWSKRMVRVRIYSGYKQLRSFLVRKTRVATHDDPAKLVVSAFGQLHWLVLPLPLAVAGVALHWGGLGVSWPVYSIAAFAAYATASLSFTRYHELAYMRRGLAWAHPLCGCLRMQFTLEALAQALMGKQTEWRGRAHVVVPGEPRPSSATAKGDSA